MLDLRNRRGAMLVLAAFLFLGLMVMAVLAIDFSRLVEQRNHVHTATDAGAHAGAVQLRIDRNGAVDTAISFATRHMPSGSPTPVVQVGRWNDATHTFTPGALDEADAIQVTAQRGSNYLIGNVLGIVPATMRRTSIAWAEAPVVAAPCLRPWALPYDSLLAKLGITDPDHELTQSDMANLQAMPLASRRVTLKLGSNNVGNAQPGNYNAVVVPSFWRAATSSYVSPRPARGGNEYQDRIGQIECNGLELVGIGDSLDVEPGNKVGPTTTGTTALCDQYGGMSGNFCLNSDGTIGLPIKVVLYGKEFGDRLNGRDDPIVVRAIGGFVLESIEMTGPDKSAITGYYDVLSTSGTIAGGGNTTLVRPILVQ